MHFHSGHSPTNTAILVDLWPVALAGSTGRNSRPCLCRRGGTDVVAYGTGLPGPPARSVKLWLLYLFK